MNIDCRVIGDLLPLSWTIISKPAPAAAKRSRG